MNADRPSFRVLAAFILAVAAVYAVYPAESYYRSYYLPFIFRHMEPGLYPGDLFVNAESVHHSAFFPAAALLLKHIRLEVLFHWLCFAATCANLALVYCIAQLWARENTPPETVFITPPYLEGFRIHSRRGIVAEAKDGAACIYDIGFTMKWWERMNDLGFSDLSITILDIVPGSRRNYAALDMAGIGRLSAKYGAGYIVTEAPGAAGLKQVYRNGGFHIYSAGP